MDWGYILGQAVSIKYKVTKYLIIQEQVNTPRYCQDVQGLDPGFKEEVANIATCKTIKNFKSQNPHACLFFLAQPLFLKW